MPTNCGNGKPGRASWTDPKTRGVSARSALSITASGKPKSLNTTVAPKSGAMAPGSKVVSDSMVGPSLANELSLTRRPTASFSTAPAGSTWAVWPSPNTTVRR